MGGLVIPAYTTVSEEIGLVERGLWLGCDLFGRGVLPRRKSTSVLVLSGTDKESIFSLCTGLISRLPASLKPSLNHVSMLSIHCT